MKTNVGSIIGRMGKEKVAGGVTKVVGNRGIQKVRKQSRQLERREEEDSREIKAYLNKLQDIVPLMPKNKRLSKLEVISNVIEYIRDLRQTLGLPPSCAKDNSSDDFNFMDSSDSSVFSALSQAKVSMVAAKKSSNAAVAATLTLASMESPVTHCHPHPQMMRQPLAAIANPTQGSS